MSLKKFAQKLNLESENTSFVDEEVVMPSIEERLDAEEAEAELVEVLDEVEEHQEALEESEEAEAEIDEHIEEAEATIAEAEGALGDDAGEATEEGDEGSASEPSEDTDGGEVDPEDVAEANDDDDEDKSVLDENGDLPVEEVVAAQEALKSVLKRTGYTLPNRIQVSREDIRNNPLEAYKMNLEDWKELKNTVSEGAKKIWEQILKAFAWIKEQIAKVWPSRETKLKGLLQEISKTSNADTAAASEEFIKAYGEKFGGVGALIRVPDDLGRFIKFVKLTADAAAATVVAKNGEGVDELQAVTKRLENGDTNFSYPKLKEAISAASSPVMGIKTSGNTIYLKFTDKTVEIEGMKLAGLKLTKELAAGYITKILAMNNAITASMDKVNASVKTLKDVSILNKLITKNLINSSISSYTAYMNNLTKFVFAYGNAYLKAVKGNEAKK
nr:MAG TPA: hypothetical protein [Caudoviricetes sp.]